MSDPVVSTALADIAGIVGQLKQGLDTVNGAIAQCEYELNKINPGFAVVAPMLYWTEETRQGADFGWLKPKDSWGLFVRRGRFVKREETFIPESQTTLSHIPLLSGTIEERVTAAVLLPEFLEGMRLKAQEHLATFVRATEDAHKRMGR